MNLIQLHKWQVLKVEIRKLHFTSQEELKIWRQDIVFWIENINELKT